MAKAKAVAEEKGAEKFMLLPVLVLILAQMGTSGDNGALSLAATALTQDLGATTADIQLANMVYSLMAGAFMIAGGMMGTIIGWKKNFRMGALLCAAGEVVLAVSPQHDRLHLGRPYPRGLRRVVHDSLGSGPRSQDLSR